MELCIVRITAEFDAHRAFAVLDPTGIELVHFQPITTGR